MDEDDGVLLPLEQAEEQRAIAAAVEEWKKSKSAQTPAANKSNADRR